MKITDSIKNVSNLSVGGGSASKSRAPSAPSAPATTSPSSGDSVASTSAPLQALQSTIAGTSTFDAQKVDSIRQAIANGQFSVDTSKVANELINSVRGLLASGNQA